MEPGHEAGFDSDADDDDNFIPECGKRLEREREAATAPHS